jgi:GTP cyclohydrolase FolE2
MKLDDVQNRPDDRQLALDQAGVSDVRHPIVVLDRDHEEQSTVAMIAMSVSLPDQFKGTNMSRFIEVLTSHRGEKAGLRRIKLHELRHSFASILTTGGAPLRVGQSLLGHSSIKMTERYAHLAPGQSAGFVHLPSVAAPSPTSGQCSGQTDRPTEVN